MPQHFKTNNKNYTYLQAILKIDKLGLEPFFHKKLAQFKPLITSIFLLLKLVAEL